MKKNFACFTALLSVILFFYSCQKQPDAIEKLKKTCLYNTKTDYFKKWSNTFTEIDIYTTSGAIQSKSFIYPIGYFQLSNDFKYNVFSDNVPLAGTWDITDSCQLVLDPGKSLERKFDVLKLSNDSLTLRRKDGNKVYTQHYIPYICPDVTKLEYQWDNTVTFEENYDNTTTFNSFSIYPVGYFKLNNDFTYNVLSNGSPLNGKWELDPNGCKLVLDKNTGLQRAFDIQKVTADSLTIWRKDTVARMNYEQHYKRH